MGRRIEQVAVVDDEREATLNRRSAQLATRLRLVGVSGDPPAPKFSESMRRDLERAAAMPSGQARRDAVESPGRRHLGDAEFESHFAFYLAAPDPRTNREANRT